MRLKRRFLRDKRITSTYFARTEARKKILRAVCVDPPQKKSTWPCITTSVRRRRKSAYFFSLFSLECPGLEAKLSCSCDSCKVLIVTESTVVDSRFSQLHSA